LRWLITDAAIWVGHELVLATWDVDVHVIVKSQAETGVLRDLNPCNPLILRLPCNRAVAARQGYRGHRQISKMKAAPPSQSKGGVATATLRPQGDTELTWINQTQMLSSERTVAVLI
jgi:hypothetical protein